ncbi:uncharacterized protein LOC121264261 isoform X3 [Juglans microcarpa x Juglans regia]|uniref:uncharacterized protein LOC121264261 isoform X3 n=1 Tax=Juglans microcarpa x Juglans regia TaxID=2249226 RepID=UPI001B7D9478|nr:uncharacterized protein LOC121264261 isoform X3 [Juglans microcarpa x Juglans regia]
MAFLGRLVRTSPAWRTLASPKTVTPLRPRSRVLPLRLYLITNHVGSTDHQSQSNASEVLPKRSAPDAWGPYSVFPFVLAGSFGVGVVESAYADGDEAAFKPPLPSESSPSYEVLEETAKKERQRIEELLRSKGMQRGSYPRFTVAVNGQKVTIKFQIPPACEVSQLIANLVSHLGLKVEDCGSSSDMLLRAWDSAVAWQLTLNPLEKRKEVEGDVGYSKDINSHNADLCILIFRSLISSEKAEIEFIKQGSLTPKELDAFVSVLELAGRKLAQKKTLERRPGEGTTWVPSTKNSVAEHKSSGVRIYGLDEPHGYSPNKEISWDNIAGYDQQKREIEDTILLALQSPKVYDDIARGTRHKFESNKPRAVLFEGPPGTGKTSCAHIIANQAIDSFAVARDSELYEATCRILSMLLRQIDGFEQSKKVVVIAATNRKQDLGPALISRFGSMITFGLPGHQNRQEIAAQYAKHLTKRELEEFATVTEAMSGRDIRDVCQQAERSWASKIIRGQVRKDGEGGGCLPPLQEYIAMTRRKSSLGIL